MKTIFKSFKFRIYPNKEQEILMSKHFGACRFIFNYYLNKRKEKYLEDKKSLNYYDNANDLTQLKKNEDYKWLKEINSQSLQSGSGTESDIKQKQMEVLSLDKSTKPKTYQSLAWCVLHI